MPDAFPALRSQQSGKDILAEQPAYDLIELFFFAYRDFVSDPDRILDEYGFGRAHHRVLHFVDRQPGLTIAELLDILRITKQSLNRVLKELIEKDFIESRMGTSDRRQRLLFATAQGPRSGLEARQAADPPHHAGPVRDGAGGEGDGQPLPACASSIPDDSAHVEQLVFGPDET